MKVITAFKVFRDLFYSYSGVKNANFYSFEETVQYLIDNKCSFIRYGDGEFNFFKQKGVHYQKYDKQLEDYLSKILNEYIYGSTNYLVGMPADFFSCDGKVILTNKSYLVSWASARALFKKSFDKPIYYGDSFLFAKNNKNIYKCLFQNDKIENLLLVHNDQKYLEDLENISNKKCHFVKIPSSDSFDSFNEILKEIEENSKKIGINNVMVIICAGPCAKALVYELSKKNIWAIDTGHCFCEPLHNIKN